MLLKMDCSFFSKILFVLLYYYPDVDTEMLLSQLDKCFARINLDGIETTKE